MADEMRNLWVGPMPIPSFLDEFLPLNEDMPASPRLPNHFDTMPKVALEKLMYSPFIDLVHASGTRSSLIPGFKLVDTSNHADSSSKTDKKVRPDLFLYPEALDTSTNRTQFDKVELLLEFKPDSNSDPFDDPDFGSDVQERQKWQFEPTAQKRRDCRGQLATYATEMSTRQFRRHIFSIFLGEPWVRFIRHDRSGAVVSTRFNYRQNSQFLVDFLWRFSHLSETQQGKDTTVRLATPLEVSLAEEHLRRWAPPPSQSRPVIVLSVPTPSFNDRHFIAWGSLADAESLTGRATRGWPVYEQATGRLMFLKDTWRSALSGMQKETETLQTLNAHNVRNVPQFVCGGDILEQLTLTHLYATMDWVCGKVKITPRIHNRFTTNVIGEPLRKFKSSYQMMQVIYDAYVAHQDAYEKCKILHRDISGGNVLISDNGPGILNDWDLARRVDEIPLGPRQFERTGTWQFISTLLLKGTKKTHDVQDDIESFVLLVLYHGLRYLPHNKRLNISTIMERVFDDHIPLIDGDVKGGDGKHALFHLRTYIDEDFKFIGNTVLTDWLDYAIESVREWQVYIAPPKSAKILFRAVGTPFPKPDPSKLCLNTHRQFGGFWSTTLEQLKAEHRGDDVIADSLAKSAGGSSRSQLSIASKRSLDDYDSEDIPAQKKKRTALSTGSGVPSSLRTGMTASPEA